MSRATQPDRRCRRSNVPDDPPQAASPEETKIAEIVKCCTYTAPAAVAGVIVLAVLGMIYPVGTSTNVAIGALGTVATSALGTAALYIRRVRAGTHKQVE